MESEVPQTGHAEHERRMGVEEAALELILKQEPQLSRTPMNNPGYDLYEADAGGSTVR